MTTELEIIYTIWDIVRAGEVNQDDPLNERLMRQFLSIHRGKLLNQTYLKGERVPDECFQDLGAIGLTFVNSEWQTASLPKIIRFDKGRHGIMVSKNGMPISVMNSEEFYNSQFDRYNKKHPRAKFINNILTLELGQEDNCHTHLDDHSNTSFNAIVRILQEESIQNTLNVNVQGVLVNTDDEPGYNFESSPYPMPDELIESLVNSVNAREFNLFLRTKADEVGDRRQNTAEFNTREQG